MWFRYASKSLRSKVKPNPSLKRTPNGIARWAPLSSNVRHSQRPAHTIVAAYIRHAYNHGMSTIRFDWDPQKAEANLRKHKVSFEDAQSVFSDERALLIDDPDHSDDEERFVLLGLSHSLRLLVVVHCYRAEGRVIRIISARKADAEERSIYR